MKQKTIVLAMLLALITASLCVPNASAAVVEPSLTIHGTVTKDVTNFSDLFAYEDEDGDNVTLDGYNTRSNYNITFDAYDIEHTDPFLNESIALAEKSDGPSVSSDWFLMRDTNNIRYILATAEIESFEAYYTSTRIMSIADTFFDRNSYFTIGGKLLSTFGTSLRMEIYFKTLDEGGEDHYFGFILADNIASESIEITDMNFDSDSYADDLTIQIPYFGNNATIYQFSCATLEDMLSVSNTKITGTRYMAYIANGTDATEIGDTMKVTFRAAQMSQPLKLNDIIVNKTDTFTMPNIAVSSNVEKIADAVIPFSKTISPEKHYNADDLTIKYDFDYSLVDDDALSISGTIANLPRGDFEWTNFTRLAVDTALITSTLTGTHYAALSGIAAGTLHTISATVECSASVYDEILAGAGMVFWSVDTILDWFYGGLAFIASIIGFGGLYWGAKQRGAKTARANAAR